MQYNLSRVGIAVVLFVAVVAGSQLAAQEYEVLAAFDNPPLAPFGGLVAGPDGLYGVAWGGTWDNGSVFRFVPPGPGETGSILKMYSFRDDHPIDGLSRPHFGLVRASDGSFYGVREGRNWDGVPPTAVYRVSPAGDYETVYGFEGRSQGIGPTGPLVEVDGELWGTCWSGGEPEFDGTVFKVSTDGFFDRVHAFSGGADGSRPEGGLAFRPDDGRLYGTTSLGGAEDLGTIFSIDPATGELETLYDFNSTSDSSVPKGELTVGPDGLVYGALTHANPSFRSCGQVFQFDPDVPGMGISVLHEFRCDTDVTKFPMGGMVNHDGFLYGVTAGDTLPGREADQAFFRIDLATEGFEVLTLIDPAEALWGHLVIADDGFIYAQGRGDGQSGGNAGSIFRIDPNDGSVSKVFVFGKDVSPRKPFSVVEDASGEIIVATRSGGAANEGAVFRLAGNGGFEVVHSFSQGDKYARPATTFFTLGSDGLLYGTRSTGGGLGGGMVFTLDETGLFSELHAFDGAYPHYDHGPSGPLVESRFESGRFFGTVSQPFFGGSLYEISSAGDFEFLFQAQSWVGSPSGRVFETEDGWLYGVSTIRNWSYNYYPGEIFRWGEGSVYQRLARLDWRQGQYPVSGLTPRQAAGGGGSLLYGVAPEGGVIENGVQFGTVYRFDPEQEEIELVYAFSGNDGMEPVGELVLAEDRKLYGMTRGGGEHGFGTLFTISTADEVIPIHHFSHEDGAYPEGPLFLGSDGNLYGATIGGGPGGGGVVFRYVLQPDLTVEERIEELIVDVGELIDDGEISYSRGRSLIAELQVALWFLKWNNGETQAIVRMQLFIIKTQNYIKNGQVDPELGYELIAKAQAIIELLR